MRIIFMGTPEFAVPVLESLINSRHEVVAVVTQPDRPKGRGKNMQFSPVKECALAHNIPVMQPVNVSVPEVIDELRAYEPELIVVVAFGQFVTKKIREMPKYGCINVHGSLLPKYRGAAPIQWAVIDGEKESGVTTMQMDAGLDTGDMLLKTVVPLDEKETGGSLFDKLSKAGADLLLETLDALENGTVTPQKQGESPTAYAKMLTKDMGAIDWNRPAKELERLIRGLNPWPSAYTFLNGKTLKVWKCAVERAECGKEAPGTIIGVDKSGIHVACGSDALILKEVQLEGKKRMETDAFLRGYQVTAGTMLKDHKE